MLFPKAVATLASAGTAFGAILWDGRFNEFTSSTDLNNWSWSNQVGPYQYYIHGSSAVTAYVNLASSYKNPADSGSKQGAKFTLDSTAYWNGQNMRRTELIPQTTAAINKGKVWYHFSIKRSATNAPSIYREHQINFFESHFTELKSGWISGASGNSNTALQWFVGGQSKWSTEWVADVWHNVAYEIDFTANTVAFWHSTGSSPLTLTVSAVSASTSSNGADWHLGVLELPVSGRTDTNEDFYFSGVYIESGSLTTSVAGPGGVVVSDPASPSTTAKPTQTTLVTSAAPVTTTAAPAGTLPKYAQCGGSGWAGSGTCVEGTTCTYSNEWYSQCL
ncbi:carbohydrate-binding module family 1 protein [Bisporella sp. PMI_857]|nr:carbohydrate-binding module family 1 protein [Bisporella sp. PMI_857]